MLQDEPGRDIAPRSTERTARALTEELRIRTRELHTRAERSGVIAGLLRGRADRHAYALYLRNLLPIYSELELGLDDHRHETAFRGLVHDALSRCLPLKRDLESLQGADWPEILPALDESLAYAGRIAQSARGNGLRLIAHSYVRYMGDLSGGQVLKRLLGRSLGLRPDQLRFYDFPEIPDAESFKSGYRAALDNGAFDANDIEAIVEEAMDAFRCNIALSDAVVAATCSVV